MYKRTSLRSTLTIAALSMLVACSHNHEHPGKAPETADKKPTNRLAVPPEVVANLGITFEQATRGKVGAWISVPGELYVPGTHRWNLRAPARGRRGGGPGRLDCAARRRPFPRLGRAPPLLRLPPAPPEINPLKKGGSSFLRFLGHFLPRK